MTDVFISYASQDRERIKPLHDMLVAEGLKVWWDRDIEEGRPYSREIDDALSVASCVVVVWSLNSVKSEWVEIEATEALERRIIVPVFIDYVRAPIRFRRLQSTHLIHFPDSVDETELQGMLMSVRAMVERVQRDNWGESDPLTITGERRDVTAMHIQLNTRVLHGGEDSRPLVRARESVLRRVSHVVEEFGGTVTHQLTDRFEAAFGIPISYEDNDLRAVYAALELRNEIDQFNADFGAIDQLDLRVGIERSLLVIGEDRGPGVPLSGYCVDVASRLIRHADHGDILLGERICEQIAPYVEIEAYCVLGEDTEKNELRGYRLVGKLATETRFGVSELRGLVPFVGRSEPLARLRQYAQMAMEGIGRALVVVGDAGIGKSRLVHEYSASIDKKSVLVCVGRCRSYGLNPAYGPFIDVLRTLLKLRDTQLSELVERVVEAVLEIDQELENRLAYFLHVLGLSNERYPMPDLERERLRFEINEALLMIITQASSERLVMIVLEDWQWADEASERMLEYLIGSIENKQVLVLVLQRPVTEHTHGWHYTAHAETLPLSPMNAVEGAGFVSSLLEDAPPEFVDQVVTRAGGNPFYMEEICTGLREAGTFEQRELEQLPHAVTSLVRARIYQLDESTRAFLLTAGIVGRTWSRHLIERVTGRTPDEVAYIITALMREGFVQQTRMVPEPRYMFKHDITRDVAEQMLLEEDRVRLHEKVGSALENLYAESLSTQFETLAFHFTRSANDDKAVSYSVAAAAQALAKSAAHNAVDHAQAALTRLENMTVDEASSRLALRAYQIFAAARILAGGYASPDILRIFERARELSEQLEETSAQFASACGLWRYHYNRGDLNTALQFAHQMSELAEAENNASWRVAAETGTGFILGLQGNLELAVACYDKAAILARDVDETSLADDFGGLPSVIAITYKGMALIPMGRITEGLNLLAQARAMSIESAHTPTQAFVWYYSSVGLFTVGRADQALKLIDELVELSTEQRFAHWFALANFFQKTIAMAVDSVPSPALEELESAANAVFDRGVHLSKPLTYTSLAVGALLSGDVAAAKKHLASARTAMNAGGIYYFSADINRWDALIHQSDDAEHAEGLLRDAMAKSDTCGGYLWSLKLAVTLAQLKLSQGSGAAELVLLEELIAEIEPVEDLPELQAATAMLAQELSA